MQISNYYGYTRPSFQAKRDMKMTEKDTNFKDNVMPKVCEVLNGMAEREVPESGPFRRVLVAFDVPNSKTNEGFIDIIHSKGNPTERILSTNVHHKNSDRVFSNFIMKGSKKEVLEHLNNPANQGEFIESIMELSKKTDEFYSSL